jgi:dipeptidyl aminopeptidase/acylaminoacyl peptidase
VRTFKFTSWCCTTALLFSAAASIQATHAQIGSTASPQQGNRSIQDSSVLTVEDIWKNPNLSNVALSQTGKYLAATAPVNGRMNLIVIELSTRKATALTNFPDFDVISSTWVGDESLLFSLGQANSPTGAGQYDGGGLFVVSRDGKYSRRISPTVREMRNSGQFVYRSLSLLRTIPGNDNEVIAAGNMTSAESTDLYRLNIKTGRYTLLTSGRPASLSEDWLLDSKLVPRVMEANVKDTLTRVIYYRSDANSPWKEIARYDATKGPVLVPLAFEADDKTLQVAYNGGRNTMAVYRYDPEQAKLGELIAQHPRFDMGATAQGDAVDGPIVDPVTDKILGYAVTAAKPEVVWLDEERQRVQKMINAALPSTSNSIQRTPDGKKWLVVAQSDVKPSRWYFLDEASKTLEEIGSAQPWLDGKLVEQRPFVFKSRDGIEMTGYYFLPKNHKQGAKLPTVLHVHGGPAVRADYWGSGFGVAEAQLFASRGYAVIVPNFRSTPGMGGKLYYSGFGTLGRQMSDDHEDAVSWGIEQGFVDPKRVCISGASYGGYAALMGPARNPDFYKCSIAGLAVTDLKYQMTTPDSDFFGSESVEQFWKGLVGVKSWDEPIVRELSPVYLASKIKTPVFLYAGQDDIRVPIEQINRMNKALIDSGNPPKAFVVKQREGHGFGKLENNVDLYNQILHFLEQHLTK